MQPSATGYSPVLQLPAYTPVTTTIMAETSAPVTPGAVTTVMLGNIPLQHNGEVPQYTWKQSDTASSAAVVAMGEGGPGGGAKGGKKRRPRRKGAPLLLATHLRAMEDKDPNCIFMVRKINRLGYGSEEILRQHYEQYGRVLEVLLANNPQAAEGLSSARMRVRPASLGFVVMSSPEAVRKVLEVGETHIVNGAAITVKCFKMRAEMTEGGDGAQSGDDNVLRNSDSEGLECDGGEDEG